MTDSELVALIERLLTVYSDYGERRIVIQKYATVGRGDCYTVTSGDLQATAPTLQEAMQHHVEYVRPKGW